MTRARKRASGFTLVELLVVVALSTVGLLGFLAMQKIATTANQRSRGVNEGLSLAQDKLEQWTHLPFANLVTGSYPEASLDVQGHAVTQGKYSRLSFLESPAVGLVKITVTVSFQSEDLVSHSVKITTVKAN